MNNSMSHWRYAGIEYDDVANGIGLGAVFFTQYCSHHCHGCHNPQTWSKDGGMEFTENVLKQLLQYFRDIPYASRLTMSGGDPLSSLDLTYYVISKFKKEFPNKTVWLYTGFEFEQFALNHPISESEKAIHQILSLCDVIVDGRFVLEQRDVTLPYVGSSNQRVIDVKKSLALKETVLWTCE